MGSAVIVFGVIYTIGTSCGWKFYKQLGPNGKLLTWFFTFTFVNHWVRFYSVLTISNNLWTSHYSIAFITLLLSYYYWRIFPKESLYRKYILVVGSVSFLLIVLISLFYLDWLKDNYLGFIIQRLYFIPLFLLYYRYLLDYPIEIDLVKIPHFWVTTGLLVFMSMSYFQFAYGNYFNIVGGVPWKFNTNVLLLSNIICYTFIIVAMIVENRNIKNNLQNVKHG